MESTIKTTSELESNIEIATFGAGCFWCTEAVFEKLEGVQSVMSGYEGGQKDDPTYEEICSGRTGHAEVVRVVYDPQKTSYGILLDLFWKMHDPTTKNQQGADIGTQYRSVIFYHSEAQKESAEMSKKALDDSNIFKAPIVTEITPTQIFFKAEDYHQDYFSRNPNGQYCQLIISPKLQKLGYET